MSQEKSDPLREAQARWPGIENPRKLAVLDALAIRPCVLAACEQAGINNTTFYAWTGRVQRSLAMHDLKFEEYVEQAKKMGAETLVKRGMEMALHEGSEKLMVEFLKAYRRELFQPNYTVNVDVQRVKVIERGSDEGGGDAK